MADFYLVPRGTVYVIKCVCHVGLHWHQCNIMMSWLNIFQQDIKCFCSKLQLEVQHAKSNLKTPLSQMWVICYLLPFVRVGQYCYDDWVSWTEPGWYSGMLYRMLLEWYSAKPAQPHSRMWVLKSMFRDFKLIEEVDVYEGLYITWNNKCTVESCYNRDIGTMKITLLCPVSCLNQSKITK